MNAIDTAREARSRNLARLRTMTIGTAALSVAATAGFGWLAAVSTASSPAVVTTAYTTSANAAITTGTSTSGAASTATAAPTVTAAAGS